jgi:hypothetical protein
MRMTRKDASCQPWLALLRKRKPGKIAALGDANETAGRLGDVGAQRGLRSRRVIAALNAG